MFEKLEKKVNKWVTKVWSEDDNFTNSYSIRDFRVVEHESHDGFSPGFIDFKLMSHNSGADAIFVPQRLLEKLVHKLHGSSFTVAWMGDDCKQNELALTIHGVNYNKLVKKFGEE